MDLSKGAVQVARGRSGEVEHYFIDVAPAPVFAAFDGLHDGVFGGVEVFGGVLVFEESQQPTWPHSRQRRR